MAIEKKYLKQIVKGNKLSAALCILGFAASIIYIIIFASSKQIKDLMVSFLSIFAFFMFFLSFASEYNKIKKEGEKK